MPNISSKVIRKALTKALVISSLRKSILIWTCIYTFLILLLWHTQLLFDLRQTEVLGFIRGSFFLIIVLTLTQIFFNYKKLLPQIVFAALPAIVMIIAYSIPLVNTNDLSYLRQFYTFAPLLFLALFIGLVLISHYKKGHIASVIIYSVLYFLFIFFALFYLGYYIIYHDIFDLYTLVSVLNTNINEVKAYLLHFISPLLIIVLACLLAFFLLLIGIVTHKLAIEKQHFGLSHPLPNKFLIFFLILFFALFSHHLMKIFPLSMYRSLTQNNGLLHAFKELHGNIEINSQQILLKDSSNKNLTSKKAPGSIILIIGESANRDRMSAFNRTLNFTTTPWENICAKQKDFSFMYNSYANFSNTIMAVTQALTNVNQYNNIRLKNAVSLIDVAKKTGYHTYWISMQGKGSIYVAGITVIAERSDDCIWSKGNYDEELLSELKKLNLSKSENNFIVLHLTGSHNRYPERVPTAFLEKHSLPDADPYKNYDNTLIYTDYVLQQIFKYAQENLNLQSMIYFSDHGEDMKYMHTSSPFSFSMVRIPFWIYLSPTYQRNYPDILPTLKNHSQAVFTNDLIFDAVSGILHADTNFYCPEYDITNVNYSITRENAKTLHGQRSISEDLK